MEPAQHPFCVRCVRNDGVYVSKVIKSSLGIVSCQWWIQDLPRGGGADHGERVKREPKRGSGGGAPSGVQGRAPGGGPLKLRAFCTFLCKKWPNVKDSNENLPPCLTSAAMTSPKFWSMREAAARTAHSWIRHCSLRNLSMWSYV